jgi:CBS domain-containing protein
MNTIGVTQRSYVGPAFKDAKVHDAMRVGVVTCQPETKLVDVARMMVGYDIHSVVVADVGGEGTPWGIVTTMDLARVADDLESRSAEEVASTDLVTIRSDAPLERAAKLMAEERVTHLLACEPGTGRPAGVLSARGLAAALAYGRS